MPQARYSSICLMVYSMPASLKSFFFCSAAASKGSLSKGLGKIQCLEMISQRARGMTQPLRLRAMLMVAAWSRMGMMPTSTGIQMPASRMASSQ